MYCQSGEIEFTSRRYLDLSAIAGYLAGMWHDAPATGFSRAGKPRGGHEKSLITIALAIGLLAGNASTASAATTATAPKLPALYNLGGASYAAWNAPEVRPGIFYIAADGMTALVGAKGAPRDKPIHWKSWTQRSAFADGYFTWRVNAAPGPYHFSAATISLWDVQTRGGARAGVRYYDKMTIDFTQCHCNSHVVLQYRTLGSGKYIGGFWDAISGRFPGAVSPAQRGAYVTTSVVTAGAPAGRKTPEIGWTPVG